MILDKFSLKGSAGIVTGGGKGLGAGIAQGLAEAGANLAIAGRTKATLEETARRLTSLGPDVLPIVADVRFPEQINELVRQTREAFGRIDFLVNNAGICPRYPSEEFPLAAWENTLAVNLTGVFLCSQAVAKTMIPQGGGCIVNIASLLSFIADLYVPAYTASKGAVLQLTKQLANDWAQYGIRVNAIAPGWMETTLTAPLKEDERKNREILSRIMLDRWGRPEDLAGAAVFLISRASEYMTGQVIVVDGGWLNGAVRFGTNRGDVHHSDGLTGT